MSLGLGIGRGPKTHPGEKGGLEKFGDRLNRLKWCIVNARSLRNKSTIFQDFVTDNKFDIVAVTETWLTHSDDAVIADLTPPGFAFLHHPRASRRGGGVGFLYNDNFSVLINPSDHYTSFESLSAVVSNGTTSLEILLFIDLQVINLFHYSLMNCRICWMRNRINYLPLLSQEIVIYI